MLPAQAEGRRTPEVRRIALMRDFPLEETQEHRFRQCKKAMAV
jgi:hypothetical protein